MSYLFNSTCMAKKNQTVCGLFAVLFISTVMVGCTNNVANKAVVKKSQAKAKQQVVVINKPRKVAGATSVQNKTSGARLASVKDPHHIAYEKKRLWHNEQWLIKREAEGRQRAQRLQYQKKYEEKQRQQAQQPLLASASLRSQRYQQRQARIESRQQQNNWRQDGTWQQAQAQQAQAQQAAQARQRALQQQRARQQQRAARARHGTNLAEQLSNAAIARTYHKVRYDGRYIPISYPMGDVPANMGVCTDTLIRSYRRLGVDLQQLVHEDISRAFHVYPNLPKWGLSSPDPNIDHRRVHNLKVFFARHGQRLPVTNNPGDYRPGDIVTWHLGGDQEHIGLVVNRRSQEDPRRHMIVHNIAKGDRMEDMLFKLPITGHYRYLPNRSRWMASR